MLKLSSILSGTLIQFIPNSKAKEILLGDSSPRISPRFCLFDRNSGKIRNETPWIVRQPLGSGILLMFVEPLDYSEKTATVAMSAWPTAVSVVWPAKAWHNARKEYETTGKIPGGIFLIPNEKLIWIGHYALEHFERAMIPECC